MPIHLIDAGGTITSRAGASGALVGGSDAYALQWLLPADAGSASVERVYTGLSENIGFRDMAAIARAVRGALSSPNVEGVVVAHGTDTMEETAFFVDLVHDRTKPVIFTGAQRHPAAADFDGIANLRDAVALARLPAAAPLGVLIAFGGRIIPACQAHKAHTHDLIGFMARDGNMGEINGKRIALPNAPDPSNAAPLPIVEPWDSVILLTLSAAMSGRLIDCAVDAGYRGIVLAAMGSGNAPDPVCAAISRATATGVVVHVATRCAGGSTGANYDSAVKLVMAGAKMIGGLPAPQARISLVVAGAISNAPNETT